MNRGMKVGMIIALVGLGIVVMAVVFVDLGVRFAGFADIVSSSTSLPESLIMQIHNPPYLNYITIPAHILEALGMIIFLVSACSLLKNKEN